MKIKKIRTYFPDDEQKKFPAIFAVLTGRFFGFFFSKKEKEEGLKHLLMLAYSAGRCDAYDEIIKSIDE